MSYLYDDLSKEPEGTFRLLYVHHGTSDLIECSLAPASLRDSPVYGALSYTWGTGSADKTILINGQVFCIRQNLWAFLRRLHIGEGRPLVIWIDAICIDQNNIPERSQQVRLMRDIYSLANRVYIWLGEDPLDDLRVFEEIMPDIPYTIRTRMMQKIRWMRERRLQAAIKNLLDNPYWNRAWIVQELSLAKSAWVLFGAHGIMPFRVLSQWLYYDEHRRRDRLSLVYFISSSKAGLELGLPSEFSSPISLWNLLVIHQATACSDPRDRLYAFIGLASDRETVGIDVDYSISMKELCAKVAAASTWHEAIAREVRSHDPSSGMAWNLAMIRLNLVNILQRKYIV